SIHQFVTCGAGLNETHYCNEKVDELLNKARTFTDYEQRKALYDEATAILMDDMPIIRLHFEHGARSVGSILPPVTGLKPMPLNITATFKEVIQNADPMSQDRLANILR